MTAPQTPAAAGDKRSTPPASAIPAHGRGPEGETGAPKLTPAAAGLRCMCVSLHAPQCPYSWSCPVCRAGRGRACRSVLGEDRRRWHAERERRARFVGVPR